MKLRLAVAVPAYLLIYTLCYFSAYSLRFDFSIADEFFARFTATLPFVLALKLSIIFTTGEWRRAFRYASMGDVVNVFVGSAVAAALLYVSNFLFFIDAAIPRSVILIDMVLTILSAGMVRISVRLLREQVLPSFSREQRKRTLIYRSNKEGIGILRTLQATGGDFQVVAFVDESPENGSSVIAGVPVYTSDVGWLRLAQKLRAQHILVPSTVPGGVMRELVSQCAQAGLKTHIIPTVPELVDGRYKVSVRDVTVSDLLRREPAELDFEAIRDYVSNKRVLVTGAAGSIGSELCRQIIDLKPASLVVVDQSEFGMFTIQQELEQRCPDVPLHLAIADVANRPSMSRIFEAREPQLVFHAAAYKHVPLMEDNPVEAIRNNILGTKVLVDLSGDCNVERFVFISTDKAVRPSNVMGATKLVSEKYVQSGSRKCDTQYISVRFGNVLNSAGSVVPTFRQQIAAGGPITVTHPEMERFFMIIPEAVQLVLQAGAIGAAGDVLILEMGEPVKIVDLAKDMICLSGLSFPDDIDIEFSGIRPGEKLREELFYYAEEGTKKVHDKIFCASREAPQTVQMDNDIRSLLEATTVSDLEAMRVLRETVERYVADDDTPNRLKSAA
ncbi:MAG: polysaccharide biosynthesis protein [Planctomycetaceae bacterium]|jgi:FlaA1/EpsC-like NDP-sugar epimerase|nr:polysaccharide biosynthesis protein [Planctomycetaceae bacterium]MBT6483780.1 polysaccharide biosynthesis protein [Planctomycetaceae bacterium]MBT6498188.1 polysaccharide biosynthesis protein [Planctomycetaceae bacterium]